MNPARLERWLFPTSIRGCSGSSPWPRSSATNRRPVSPDNPFVKVERDVSGRIEQALDQYRDMRDDLYERMFKAIYESPWLAAVVGLEAESLGRRGPQVATWEQEELKRLKRKEVESHIEEGTLLDAWARLLLYVRPEAKRRRRAAFQYGAADDRGAEAGERALARRAEGSGEAAGVRARARRGARHRGAAEARARAARTDARASRPRGSSPARAASRRPPGGTLPPGREHPRSRYAAQERKSA